MVARCEDAGRGADAGHRVLEQVPVDDVEDRPAESDGRVVVQNRSRGGVVEKDPSVHVADHDRDGELGHQRGQSISLLLETLLCRGDLGGDLAFGYATPLGQGLHRGGQLLELGRPRPVHQVVRVRVEQQPGLGGEASGRGGVAADEEGDQRDETGEHQRATHDESRNLTGQGITDRVLLVGGKVAPQQ